MPTVVPEMKRAIRAPCNNMESRSVPFSSVPNQWVSLAGARTAERSWASGSKGAKNGPRKATPKNANKSILPSTVAGRVRPKAATRRPEAAPRRPAPRRPASVP